MATKKKQNELSGDDYAMAYLLSLSKEGLIACQATEPNSSMLVEPSYWKNLLHKDKMLLMQAALLFYVKCNKLKGMNIEWVGVFDMITQEKYGSINMENGKITIEK